MEYQVFEPKKDLENVQVEINLPRVQLVNKDGDPVYDKDGNAMFDRAEGEALRIGGADGHKFPFQARSGAEEAALGAHPLLRKAEKKAKGGGRESLKANGGGSGEDDRVPSVEDNGGES